jgi:hypothetical protein
MTKTNAFETSVNDLFFTGTPIADVADDDQSTPATTLTISLHTGDPGEAGTMLTNEAAYGSYARQTVARTSGGFTVTGATVALVANLDFPEATSGTETITHFGVGTGVSDNLMYSGTVTSNISVVTGVTPRLNAGVFLTED